MTKSNTTEGVGDLIDLTGQIAIVTGAAQGIGLATAALLAQAGARVTGFDLNRPDSEIDRMDFAEVDVTDEVMVEHAVRDVHDCYGRLDILVNCAGISEPGEIASVSPESWSRVIGVNLTGTMMCCRACFPIMKAAGFGRIVNIASVMALRGTLFGTNASYTASKAGVIGLTKELAVQGADFGVHVNAISPGITATEMLNALAEEQKAKLASFVLLKRLASPTEIAYGILFLVSRLSSYVTGEVLNPNGGLGLGIGALKGQ